MFGVRLWHPDDVEVLDAELFEGMRKAADRAAAEAKQATRAAKG